MKELFTLFERSNVLKLNNLFLFYCTAKWCRPCRTIYPSLLRLEKGLDPNKITFIKIDIENHDDFCEKHNIRSVPTFMIIKDNEIKDKCTGADINKVGNLIKKYYI